MFIVVIIVVVVILSIVQQIIVVSYKSHNTLQFTSIRHVIVVSYHNVVVFVIIFECDSSFVIFNSQKFFVSISSIHLNLFFEKRNFFTNQSFEIILTNEIIIYQFIEIKTFVVIIKEFFIF